MLLGRRSARFSFFFFFVFASHLIVRTVRACGWRCASFDTRIRWKPMRMWENFVYVRGFCARQPRYQCTKIDKSLWVAVAGRTRVRCSQRREVTKRRPTNETGTHYYVVIGQIERRIRRINKQNKIENSKRHVNATVRALMKQANARTKN